ncbi:MAG: hypothetical protein BGO37_05770 [Cellulomonas sp. 73-92]|uniref:helicase-associated domain-containing protein n=1 Tax=Cellulomonas sp. 73-92 TaxID=1895740 RepID=UPI00092B40E6|nr:helicase-associated domain-containing protein [Cellulomonas sp. 73-92]OJV81454.1 MAG: hypothetical protein BGO37_05770 [Cellulomonas sp. 73-92]
MAISDYLTALDDEHLVALLRRRPDLASPSPVTLASLAARATSRSSLERALASVDAAVLQAVEAVVALAPDGPPSRERVVAAITGPSAGDGGTGSSPAPTLALPAAPGDGGAAPLGAATDASFVGRAVDEAIGLALVWPDDEGLHAAPGLAEILGPYPAGLAPAPTETRLTAPAGTAPTGASPAATAPAGTTPSGAIASLAAGPAPVVVPGDLPADERAVLDALTWGPPVGLVPAAGNAALPVVGRLLDAGLLVRGGARQVVLPRAVALALRDGRTHRAAARPPAPDWPVRRPDVVAAESASAAERLVRLVVRLVTAWGEEPPSALRAGGLGVRDLRALAHALDIEEAEAAFVVELASTAGLVADDGEERPSFAPTEDADAWLRRDLPARWAHLAAGWLTSERTPWLVGTRDERGSAHGALEPDLHRRWVPRVRAAVLDVLATAPAGAAPPLDDVLAVLRWRTPRNVPPSGAVTALLREAELLGVTGAGALSPAGRASPIDPSAAADALAASLPTPVDEVLLQGDLTGIVPGRPGDRLAALLDRTAVVESRGGALTVRFTPESVRAALDAGATADELLAELTAVARSGVPQPLRYLVRDTARRHGVLRAGVALAYLRADDAALLAGLPDDPRLAGLGLRLLAPTVLVAAVPPVELVTALRGRGLAPVMEGPDGLVVHAPAVRRRTRPRPQREEQPPDDEARLTALVARLRRAEAEASRDGAHEGGPSTVGGSGAGAASGRWGAGQEGLGRATGRGPGRSTGASRPVAARTGHAADAARGSEAPAGSPGPSSAARPAPDAPSGTADPAAALLLLREAAAERSLVWVDVVGGRGVLERRLLRPVSVDGGRLRAIDPAREAELVVAVHRIAGAERAS